jgi:drug/metabolite transporter (DMT)-like permease
MVIPFTMIFSMMILRRRYTGQQYVGGLLTISGILVSLIPIFDDFSTGDNVKFYWPLIFVLGVVPGVLMNIFEEHVFNDMPKYDNIYLLAWESLYQVITVGLLFWTDMIPGFGVSGSASQFFSSMGNGFKCFFSPWSVSSDIDDGHCNFCAFNGVLFTCAYCFSYIFGAKMMKYATANSTALISAVSPAFVVFFWITFPALNGWAGGDGYSKLQIICYCVALPVILLGIFVFRKAEKAHLESKIEDYSGLESGLKDPLHLNADHTTTQTSSGL